MSRRVPVPLAVALASCLALFVLASAARAETPDAEADPQSQTTTTVTVTGTAPAGPPVAVLKFGENSLRIGFLAQPTYEGLQDANSGGYSQNFYLRRVRFNLLGKLGKTVGSGVQEVELFFQTDSPRAGNAAPPTGAKNNGSTGFLVQDAYGQWAFAGQSAMLRAGLWIVPTIRQVSTSVATFLALDLPTWGLQQNTFLGGNGGRDYGVGLNGYLMDDHLSYNVGVFSGARQPATNQAPPLGQAACCRNSPRFAGRLMYDFFDPEKGYAYQGTYRGAKKVVAIAGIYDVQGSYEAYGGDFFLDWPIGSDAVTFEGDYIHYNGWGKFYSAIPEQDTLYVDAGYYFSEIHLQPFARYEFLHFAAAANKPKEQQRFGGGFNYYVMGQNFKIVPYYERIIPKVEPTTAKQKDTNRFVVEIQVSL